MKALTLIQPWASLIVDDRKKTETRSWGTKYRGPLLIHAGAKINSVVCREAGYDVLAIPIRALLCIVELVDCFRFTGEQETDGLEDRRWGDFSPGRWGWRLRVLHRFERPIEARGSLGLWECSLREVTEFWGTGEAQCLRGF